MSALQRALASPDIPLSEQDVLAVAAYRPDPTATPPQYHVGIVYRDPDDNHAYFLHLAWHCRLRRDHYGETPVAGEHLWIIPPFDEIDLGNIISVCRNIWSANRDGKIPYGFSSYASFFNTTTWQQLAGPANIGLTCASFVLATFKTAEIDLIRPETWTARPDDQAWKEWVLANLECAGAGRDHINLVKTQIAGLRYRPTDVAAASLTTAPSSMAELTAAVIEIEAAIDRLGRHGR